MAYFHQFNITLRHDHTNTEGAYKSNTDETLQKQIEV